MPRLIWVFAGRTCHFVGFVTMRLIWPAVWLSVSVVVILLAYHASCRGNIFIYCLLIRSANFSYGFLRKSGHAHYSMFLLQQNPPLAFGRTMLWKWLKRSCWQCTLQAAHFNLAFSLLLLKFIPITWKTLPSPTTVIFSLSVLKINMTDHCLMKV